MSNVVKSKRQKTQFEANHNLIKLHDEVTKMCFNRFGFSVNKSEKNREKYRQQCKDLPNSDELMQMYDEKTSMFNDWFIKRECCKIMNIFDNLYTEFTLGNAIYPSNVSLLLEYLERRRHMDNAIGLCYCLRNEVNYIARTITADKNKYKNISELIEAQIKLIKGVRQSDNRFLKDLKNTRLDIRDIINYLFADEIISPCIEERRDDVWQI